MLFNELHQGGIRALLDWDPSLFDDMVLPEDLDDEDGVVRGLIKDDIILRHGDTPLFIPEPSVMKYYIKSWSVKMLPIFTRYYNACMAEYDPIENYNRIEHRTEDRDDSMGNERTLDTATDTTGTDTNEDSVSAENVVTFSPNTKSVRTPDLNVADSGTITDEGSYDGYLTVDSTIHGNIGVTTSQQMLESELALVPKLDIVRIISDSWAAEFCLAVY